MPWGISNMAKSISADKTNTDCSKLNSGNEKCVPVKYDGMMDFK